MSLQDQCDLTRAIGDALHKMDADAQQVAAGLIKASKERDPIAMRALESMLATEGVSRRNRERYTHLLKNLNPAPIADDFDDPLETEDDAEAFTNFMEYLEGLAK